MSWITPIKNTFIKFIVKGNGSGGGGGIDEETLNEKLAQFYATTETKILNIVNQKLASYVLQTAFNELKAKVNTNTTDISALKQRVTVLESKPSGGGNSSLTYLQLKVPSNVLIGNTEDSWKKLWNNKEVSLNLKQSGQQDGQPVTQHLVSEFNDKKILSIVNAYYFTKVSNLGALQPFQPIILTTLEEFPVLLINGEVTIFNGTISMGTTYTQSNPYTPTNDDYLFLELLVCDIPTLTESTENGITIKKGGV